MKKLFLTTVATIGAMVGFSQPATAAAGWTDFGAIGEINQQGSTTPGNEMVFVTIAVTTNPSDPSACTLRNSFYFAVSTDLQKRLFAMLLSAKATGQNVRVYVTANCHLWGSAEMQGMVIQ